MNLRQIEVLRAFMLTRTVSGAAAFLHISQPGVSKILKHIEDQLGVQLFQRLRGRLLPTVEAEQLFATIGEAWAHVERVERVARNLGSGAPATLRIGTTPSLGAVLVPSVIATLMKRHKQLRVRVELSAPDMLLESLLTRKIDVAVTLFSVSHPEVLAEKVATSPLVCIMPRDHPLARGTFVTPAEMQAFQFISFSSETPEGRLIDDLFAQAGFDRQVAIEVRSSASACWFVKAGAGIAIVDSFAVYQDAFPGVVARPLQPDLAFDINICTHAFAPISDALIAFSKETKRQCRWSQRK